MAEQAEVSLTAEESCSGPFWISPLSRRLMCCRKRLYTYTLTVEPLNGTGTTPKSQLGSLKAAPLIGPWWIVALSLLSLVLLAYLLSPSLIIFNIDGGGKEAAIR